MKKFLIFSVIALSFHASGFACGPMEPVHNYYMFNVHSHASEPVTDSRLIDFWKSYTGEKRTADQISREFYQTSGDYYFGNSCQRIFAAAKRKNDTEMITYIRHLINYGKICDQLKETWDYPTKKQLASRKLTLQNLRNAAKAYRGRRLKQQYALLYMRANLLAGNYQNNETYWAVVASKSPAGVYRDLMQNLYANALLHRGQWRQACDIYVAQQDWNSVAWAMRKYRNVAGIRNIYAADPNSPTLNYLVQDFVNSAQETIDNGGDRDMTTEVGKVPVFEKDVRDFISFANSASASADVKNPCLWKSATAMLHYLLGDRAAARTDIDRAMSLKGDEHIRDNARCIRLLVYTGSDSECPANWLAEEFRWLDSKRSSANDYYSNVMDRVVFSNLAPRYRAAGSPDMSAALMGMMNETEHATAVDGTNQHAPSFDWNKKEDYQYNSDYALSEYFDRLDSMTADGMAHYFTYLQSSPRDAFERFVLSRVYKDANFFNDFIGTKYIAEGRFGDALPYLRRVELSFLSRQNICYYMAHRDFTQDRWFAHQKFNEDIQTDGYNLATLADNPKVKFCEDMLQLQSQYTLARDDNARRLAAYNLASRYFQSSCYGDCWYLSHYAHSVMDSARTYEMDFAQKTLAYLTDSKQSTDLQLMQQSLYACAYVNCVLMPFDWAYEQTPVSVLIRGNRAASQAYAELSDFVRRNQPQDRYITKCDVLKSFMSSAN